ncbi:S-adenosyl-l-methionine hydroxide adenosyltransferase family protein [Vaginella massiliensis]|uniref:SAM hydrolase/SAM-dependent halogenase family protein n=1 Tax=Vaginella massiliensis TaxID=1816680 RepID=UPI0008384B9D|nr:SAM-dependent chlorinase/fluorinase [Vaginella massiliensis]
MSIITLTTDFGYKDYFVAALKGQILSELPNASIIDITHQVSHYDIAETAFIVQKSYPHFPKGSIHIIGVNAVLHPNQKPMCFLFDEHYFIVADNGFISLLCEEKLPDAIYEISINSEKSNSMNAVADIFVPVACHLARGGVISLIGNKRSTYHQLTGLKPIYIEDRVLRGNIVYIDHFGNAVTNISRQYFQSVNKGRAYKIFLRQHDYSSIQVTTIHNHYNDMVIDYNKESIANGKTMAIFNSSGFLEVTLYKSNPSQNGSAQRLMGLKKGDVISIEFTV